MSTAPVFIPKRPLTLNGLSANPDKKSWGDYSIAKDTNPVALMPSKIQILKHGHTKSNHHVQVPR